ncbi:hypothetical protein LOZ45_006093 [Ophidiomyces ophidiicola]|nr:hypothetical protein LOZ45_006093 [Ophidiomyces ophidiicola]
MLSFRNILEKTFGNPFPETSPALTPLECMVFDENSLEHLLSRSISPAVTEALGKAFEICYGHNTTEAIAMTRGGRARKTDCPGDPAKFPDWAGVIPCQNSPGFENRCPGDTKLSTKWKSVDSRHEQKFFWPLWQVCYYCTEDWTTRYGYLITQEELVVLRFYTRDRIDPGLAQTRGVRSRPTPSPPRHQRLSISTVISDTSTMSLDSSPPRILSQSSSTTESQAPPPSSSFHAESTDGETRLVEMKSIPWDDHGPNKLTIELALWWIHMLAAAPNSSITLEETYPSLVYQHVPRGPSTPQRNRREGHNSSPLSSPMSVETPAHLRNIDLDIDQLAEPLRWDEHSFQFRYITKSGVRGSFRQGASLFSTRMSANFWVELGDEGDAVLILDWRSAIGGPEVEDGRRHGGHGRQHRRH